MMTTLVNLKCKNGKTVNVLVPCDFVQGRIVCNYDVAAKDYTIKCGRK